MNKINPFDLLAVLPAQGKRHAAAQRFLVRADSHAQRNGSRQGGGKLPGVRVVGAADTPGRLLINSIIVGFGIFFNPAFGASIGLSAEKEDSRFPGCPYLIYLVAYIELFSCTSVIKYCSHPSFAIFSYGGTSSIKSIPFQC